MKQCPQATNFAVKTDEKVSDYWSCEASCPAGQSTQSITVANTQLCDNKCIRGYNLSGRCVEVCPSNIYNETSKSCIDSYANCSFIKHTEGRYICVDKCNTVQNGFCVEKCSGVEMKRETTSGMYNECMLRCPKQGDKQFYKSAIGNDCVDNCGTGKFRQLDTMVCVAKCPPNYAQNDDACELPPESNPLKSKPWAVPVIVFGAVLVALVVCALAAVCVVKNRRRRVEKQIKELEQSQTV